MASGDLKGAMKVVNEGLNKDPSDMAAMMVAASIVSREGCWGMAYNLLHRVRENSPPHLEILNNLGMASASLGSSTGREELFEEAERHLRKAMKRERLKETLSNMSMLMVQTGRPVEAESFARECIQLDPGNAGAMESLGYACLHQGKWAEGFPAYDFNLGGKYRPVPKGYEYWKPGTKGKRILVFGEQGIGDEITYASVLPDAARDNKITYECDPRLYGLFKRSLPNVEVKGTRFKEVAEWRDEKRWDAACLTGSLCREYRRSDADFPRSAFLIPDGERCLQWRSLLTTLPGKKVGIAWTGGLPNTFQSRRSFNLEGLLPILKIPGITWVSLQYKAPSDEIAALREKHGIEVRHWERAVGKGVDYDETAALVSELDAVVSVTTAAVHLCGALGKKCYVLVPKRCRWFYNSTDSRHRWYDSLELFRQEDKWPVERLADRLKADLCG